MNNSPLRYPGGKNKLAAFVAKICIDNQINGCYVEPYAGGASVALFLLLNNIVKKIVINDKDRSIYAFWHSVLYQTEQLCNLISTTTVSVEEWHKQRKVQEDKESVDLLSLGFSTFFLNRTNRSGIITGGIIGGVNQTGDYPIDCRFNKVDLINRIKVIADREQDITLYNMDAIDLIEKIQKDFQDDNNVLCYFDPPYFFKANSLYLNHYKADNHKLVSEKIIGIKNLRWLVSYDNVPEIQNLYSECDKLEYSFKHTAHTAKEGKEILFFSPTLLHFNDCNPIHFKARKKDGSIKIVYKEPKIKEPLNQTNISA